MSEAATANSSQSVAKPWQFKKGQSGNPSGRPAILKHLRELAREHTQEALDEILKLMRNDEHGSVRLNAAQEILNRAWGRPEQFIDVGVTVEHKSQLVEQLMALLTSSGAKVIDQETHPAAIPDVTQATGTAGT